MSAPSTLDALTQCVRIPFLPKKMVPVVVDLDCHPALAHVAGWDATLKGKIENACFAHYRDKLDSVGESSSLPRIRRPNEVWKHIEIKSVRIDVTVPNSVVIYAVPAWDVDEQMEWCIEGDKLVYVGQFLRYSVGGHKRIRADNFASARK